jgi:hypothetical protein
VKPTKIIIHSSASAWGTALDIHKWHSDPPPQGNGWREIGYHAVITNGYPARDWYKRRRTVKILDGQITMARPFNADADLDADERGAHCYGYNNESLAVCLIGGSLANGEVHKITRNEIVALVKLCKWWMYHFDLTVGQVFGHYEMPTASGKTCPDLEMDNVRKLIELKSESMNMLDLVAKNRKES